MGNVTHVLSVLQWLEVVIAFVSSFERILYFYRGIAVNLQQQFHTWTPV